MKKNTIIISALTAVMLGISGCQVVGGIFKAGMAWGIILVFLVIFGIIWLVTRGRNK